MAEIALKVAVMTSSGVKINFVVTEITFKVPVINSSGVKITFVVTQITFSVSNPFVIGQNHLCSNQDNFQGRCDHFFSG